MKATPTTAPLHFLLTLTADQAEAVGYALARTLRPLDSPNPIDVDLAHRLRSAADELDTCPTFTAPATEGAQSADQLAAIAARRAAAALDQLAAALRHAATVARDNGRDDSAARRNAGAATIAAHAEFSHRIAQGYQA